MRRRTLALALALVVAFGLGLAAALYLAWVVWPVDTARSEPADLSPNLQEGYLVLIAEAYDHDGNLGLARQRLEEAVAPGGSYTHTLVFLTKRYLEEGQDLRTLRKLVRLTHALGASTTEMLVYLPADQPTPTRTPTSLATPSPEPTALAVQATPSPAATATPAPTYRLVARRRLCQPEEGPGQVQVVVQDAAGRELPGVRLGLAWPEGGGTLFTGLHPGQGDGYADAQMDQPGEYRITVLQDGGGDVVGQLYADPEAAGCPAEARSVIWQVVFERVAAAP